MRRRRRDELSPAATLPRPRSPQCRRSSPAAEASAPCRGSPPRRPPSARPAGGAPCVRPQPRHRDLRGQNSSQPEPIATSRRRAGPHRASRPPQHGHRSKPAVSRDSTPSAEPRTVTIRCPPPAPPGGPSRSPVAKDHGEGRCHHLHGHSDAVHHPAHREPAGLHQIGTVNDTRHPSHSHPQRRVTAGPAPGSPCSPQPPPGRRAPASCAPTRRWGGSRPSTR